MQYTKFRCIILFVKFNLTKQRTQKSFKQILYSLRAAIEGHPAYIHLMNINNRSEVTKHYKCKTDLDTHFCTHVPFEGSDILLYLL